MSDACPGVPYPVGSETDSCWFGDCQYLGSNWTWQPAVLDTLVSDATDSSQWGVAIHDEYHLRNDFEIWDKIPQERAR
jgi:hypothetical protein